MWFCDVHFHNRAVPCQDLLHTMIRAWLGYKTLLLDSACAYGGEAAQRSAEMCQQKGLAKTENPLYLMVSVLKIVVF